MNKHWPRVLLIAHNPFSLELNNGKTYTALFRGWPRRRLAQFFSQNEVPDFSVCGNFYQVSDEMMLRGPRRLAGRVVGRPAAAAAIRPSASPVHGWGRRHPQPAFDCLRNVIWSRGRWDNRRFAAWLAEFRPEVILLVGGRPVFPYRIAGAVSRRLAIPVCLYYTDDYITPIASPDPGEWLGRYWLTRELGRLLPRVERVFVVGEAMAREYRRRLKKRCVPVMNAPDPAFFDAPAGDAPGAGEPLRLAYFGGLHLGRHKTLAALGRAARALAAGGGPRVELSVYSARPQDAAFLAALAAPPFVHCRPAVRAGALVAEMSRYQGLVFVESFQPDARRRTRLSLSTKIPEYLALGRPLLAVGPGEIAPLRYLAGLGTALVVDSPAAGRLQAALAELVARLPHYQALAARGREIAARRHDAAALPQLVREELAAAVAAWPREDSPDRGER